MVKRIFCGVLLFSRWYAGLLWLLAGLVGLAWAPVALIEGNAAWILIAIGAGTMIAAGWLIHPWGVQRGLEPDGRTKPPRSWLRWAIRARRAPAPAPHDQTGSGA